MRRLAALPILVAAVLLGGCPSGGGAPAAAPGVATPNASPPDPHSLSNDVPAPQAQPRFADDCKVGLASARELRKTILEAEGPRTVANTLVPLNHLTTHLLNAANRASLYANVHPDAGERAAAETCEQEAQALATDLRLDPGLYAAVKALDVKGEAADTRFWVERLLRDFTRSGVDKDEATRQKLRDLADAEVKVGQEYQKNLRDDVRSILVTAAQLDGLPADFIAGHLPGPDGKVKITTDNPDYTPFMTYAKDAGARRELLQVRLNRAMPANLEVFRKLLDLRRQHAQLLGFKDWADYVTGDKMIGSGAKAREFIEKVTKLSKKSALRDEKLFLSLKKKDDPKAKRIDGADWAYYEALARRELAAFDPKEVRPYFVYDRVLAGLLSVNSKLFDVSFEAMPDAIRWDPSVRVYDVKRAGKKIGTIYLDMHPREGKYKHAAQFDVVTGVDGEQLPEAALVCNFPDPTVASGGALMEFDDVKTMFHEFGHLMHTLVGGRQRWAELSGVATERDFVEAPSQLLEEWALDAGVLAGFATHVDTGAPIPAEMVARLRKAKEVGKGLWARQQLFYAAYSLRVHQDPSPLTLDPAKLMEKIQGEYSLIAFVPGTNMWSNWTHLEGYSAMYYTYMWSLVIAKDLFSPFEKAGLMDAATAAKYRESVLAPGGSKPAADLAKDFLGRPYGFEAFARWLDR